jgi:thioredoxin-related protein
MKKFVLFITLIACLFSYSQDLEPDLDWLLDINEALELSEKEHKPLLVYFTGSDWCSPCKMLKKDFFSNPKFKERSTNMVLLMVDMPRRVDIISQEQKEKNIKLVRKYNKSGGYPNLVALNSNGDIIGELGGYTFLRETDRHFAFVDSVIENYK